MSKGAVDERRVGNVVGRRGTVLSQGINRDFVFNACFCVIVRIDLGDLGSDVVVGEWGKRGCVSQSSVENKEARVCTGHDGSNVCIHLHQVGMVLVAHVDVIAIIGHRGYVDGMVGELPIHVGEDGSDGERGWDKFHFMNCLLDHWDVDEIVFIVVVVQSETVVTHGGRVIVRV